MPENGHIRRVVGSRATIEGGAGVHLHHAIGFGELRIAFDELDRGTFIKAKKSGR